VAAAEVSSVVEVCEARVLLSAVTPVISQSQAQTDVTNAQAGYNSAVATYQTSSQGAVDGYSLAMQGHYSTFSSNVTTLGGSYDTAVQGILATHSGNVQSLQTSFDLTVAGLVSGLEGNYASSEATYSTATTGHYNTYSSAMSSIESGLNSQIATADGILNSATTAAYSQFSGTESTASGQYDTDIATADGNYNTAVAGHDAWLQSQEAAAFATYDGLAGDNPTGAMGVYNSIESTESATRDGVLTSYPNSTYDPMSVSSIDFNALWNTALSGVQTSLTTAETNYQAAISAAESAYQTGLSNASSTYSSMMATADSDRDSDYATADGTYNTNTSSDWNDYNTAVYGAGGIEETWQNSINTADSTYSNSVSIAMAAYDSTMQSAQATLDGDIAAAYQKFDDWQSGNLVVAGAPLGQSITMSFERTQTIDTSTSPVTVYWTTSSSLLWGLAEGTSTLSRFEEKPPVPDGYTFTNSSISVSGSVTTITETYAPPVGGLGTGLRPGLQQANAAVLTPAHHNPWELAKVARTEFYLAELDGYYDQYTVAMNTAQTIYNGAVQAANAGYNTTLYGDPTGITIAPGTPAETFNSALTAAYSAFDSGEQSAKSNYDTNINGYYMAESQYWMDMMMGIPATPPNPDDPAQFAKDYYIDTTALDIDFAVAVGAAWTGWVSAQVGADTTRDNALISAEHQLGLDSANAANALTTAQIAAESSYAKDMIDINADYAIAIAEKLAEVQGDIADAEKNFELTEHGAAQTAGKAINAAEKVREDDYATADETRAEALSLEDEDLANDLAAEEETRQNAYATADADWLSDEAAANIASTALAATATSGFLTGLVAADVGFVTAAAPLITTATQAFNNLVDAAYVAAFPGDADQAAVSGAWTTYYNAMVTAAQNALTSEATAYQSYIGSMATDIQTTMNNVAGESTQLATDYGNALSAYVSSVAAAATLHTSQVAAAGVVWVDSVATDTRNAIHSATAAWKQMADDDVDAAKTLADDYSNFWNGFAHSYLAAAVPHETAVINEDRQASKDADDELTTLAQGIAAEQHDLNLDDLAEWLSTALSLSSLDDALINAWATLESAWSIISAWDYHTYTQSAPLSDFAYYWGVSAGPMTGLNHNLDLAGGNDDVVQQAALAATSQGSSWSSWLPWNWSVFSWRETPRPLNGATRMGEQQGLANNWKVRRDLMLETGKDVSGLQAATATAGGLGGAALDHAESAAVDLTLHLAGAGSLKYGDDLIDLARSTRRLPNVLDGGEAYRSFSALKRALGAAGENKHWHHIVEQSQIGQFGTALINNTKNVVALDAGIHAKISGYFSSIQDFSNGLTVRQWLSGKSFEEQYQFGLNVIQRFTTGL
tara:strand:- start:219347 stop:223417 length:4071 start_codon:yes stop_codon:yes gene_type:complete